MSDTHEMLKAQVKAHRASVEGLYEIMNGTGFTRSAIDFLDREGASGLVLEDFYDMDEHPDGIDEDTLIDYGSDTLRDAATDLFNEAPLSVEGIWKGESAHKALYQGCTVVFGTGGPHVELDTVRRQWVGYWGGETVYRMADPDLCDYYDGLMEG